MTEIAAPAPATVITTDPEPDPETDPAPPGSDPAPPGSDPINAIIDAVANVRPGITARFFYVEMSNE